MKGRMLYLKPPKNKKREILLLYGHHASIERMEGISLNMNKYGAVTLPDLPGFGGMDSFYKINRQPTLDNYADYLATFVKLRYKRKRLTIMAMSYSFPIITRMLQKYPEIAKKVDMLISTVGFVHHDDFSLPRWQQLGLYYLGRIFERKPLALFMRYLMLQKPLIKLSYMSVRNRHSKMKDASDKEEFNRRIKVEVRLWKINDVRTRMRTMADIFNVDVCDIRVPLKVYHVFVENDRYFDNRVVEQHMRVIYDDFVGVTTTVPGHMPSIVATAEEAAPFIPASIKRLLARSP